MIDLLKNQRISKREHSPMKACDINYNFSSKLNSGRRQKVEKKPAYRPGRVLFLSEQNSRYIDKVKQKPSGFSRGIFRKPGSDESSFRSFVIPVFSAAGLFAVVLGIFFIINSQGGSLDWTGRNVAGSKGDESARYNLAVYAGVQNEEHLNSEAIPLDLTETFQWKSYTVKKGDSVSKIAASFSLSMDAIIASNGISNARILREGEKLRVPNMDGIPYTVRKGDSLSGISRSMGVPLEAILDANDIQSDAINAGLTLFIPGARMNREDLKLALGELFIYPVKGAKLTSPYGWRNDPFSGVRRHHAALDLSAPQGTPVTAAMDGKVLALGYNGTYGNYIILSHSGEYQTMYAHLHTTTVAKGDNVVQGRQIGTVGNTGYSTGPHLHFAIFKNSRPVNPLDYLNSRK